MTNTTTTDNSVLGRQIVDPLGAKDSDGSTQLGPWARKGQSSGPEGPVGNFWPPLGRFAGN